jgi:acyl-coenzyme A synthetase/AMP-(fatty) acid ligase/thioesterase domain-containing protein
MNLSMNVRKPPLLDGDDCRRSIVDRFVAVTASIPDSLALESAGSVLAYGELHCRSDALACSIAATSGVCPGLGAIVLDQDIDAVVAMLGILKTGSPYTFVDLSLPDARLAQISALAQPAFFVTDAEHEAVAHRLAGDGAPVLLVDAVPAGKVWPTDLRIGFDDPANIVFTSGSTGQPKGVIVPHGAYIDHALAASQSMDFSPEDRMGLILPMGFAAAALYLHRGLAMGAPIHLYDPRQQGIEGLAAWVRRNEITYLDFTPTLLRSFLKTLPDHEVFPLLRVITTAGEPLFGNDVAAIAPHLPSTSVVINHAGSSETSGYAVHTVFLDRPLPSGQIPSGHPLGDRSLDLQSQGSSPDSSGEPGELVVTSPFVSLGYWRQPELTAERFSFLSDGRRSFRTGDLALRRADGVLEHRGRLDAMVKIRGYLVEPAEVENALLGTGEVSAAAVLGLQDTESRTRLAAYVVPSQPKVSAASIRRALREVLPNYMVPSSVVLMPELPRNASGKIDRLALKEVPLPESPAPTPPRNALELQLSVMWADILGVDSLGVEDDFFALGGDSLAAEALMAAIAEDIGHTLPTSALIESPTISEFARQIEARRTSGAGSMLVPLRKTGTRPPLFVVTGVATTAASYVPISLHLGPDQPLYVLLNQGFENRGLPDFSVARAARRAIRAIKSVQPAGPYLLAGHSWGGILAYEIAHQLTRAGDQVAFLGLLDVIDQRYPWELEKALAECDAEGLIAANVQNDEVGQPTSRIRGWWRQMRVVGRVVIEALSDRPRTDRTVDAFSRFGAILIRRYRPPRWKGPATVIEASDMSDERLRMNWDDVLVDPPHRRRVPGNHRSILREPNAGALADVIAKQIDSALASRTAPVRAGAAGVEPAPER